jgi:hypothetical protein
LDFIIWEGEAAAEQNSMQFRRFQLGGSLALPGGRNANWNFETRSEREWLQFQFDAWIQIEGASLGILYARRSHHRPKPFEQL